MAFPNGKSDPITTFSEEEEEETWDEPKTEEVDEEKETEGTKKTKEVKEVSHEWEQMNKNEPLWVRKSEDVTNEEYTFSTKACQMMGRTTSWVLWSFALSCVPLNPFELENIKLSVGSAIMDE